MCPACSTSKPWLPPLALALASLTVAAAGCSGDAATRATATSKSFAFADLVDPPVEYRPWVRWWWPGNDVEDGELDREIGVLADGGFGGAEIQPFDAGLDPNAPPDEVARRLSYPSAAFFGHVRAAATAAAARGLRLDLNVGSGWPPGGAGVPLESSIQTLLWSLREVTGPVDASLDLGGPEEPFFYPYAAFSESQGDGPIARYEGTAATRIAVIAERETGGTAPSGVFALGGPLDLDPSSARVLTSRVDASGHLDWRAPDGRWAIVSFFTAPDGEYPVFDAEPDPGWVVDPLDRDAVQAFLDQHLGAPTGLDLGAGTPFRALFLDSFEYKAERHVSRDFLAEFRRRRGYDVTPYLPAVPVPGTDNTVFTEAPLVLPAPFQLGASDDDRIRHDYGRTVSELFVERSLATTRDWAAAHGALLRVQPYGIDVAPLAAGAATDIVETEQIYGGGAEMFLALASSAAELHGLPLASAESFGWEGRDAMTTPLKMKVAAQKLAAAGIQQVVIHGFPYVKEGGYGETGWLPFSSPFGGGTASSNLGESDPFSGDLPAVTKYLARLAYVSRQGEPASDVLVYYPWLGFPASFGSLSTHREPLFDGRLEGLEPMLPGDPLQSIGRLFGFVETDPRSLWLETVWPELEELERAGYQWRWIDDGSLASARAERGAIVAGEHAYGGLVIANAEAIEVDAAKRVANLAEKGAAIVIAGDAPSRQRGFADAAKRDAEVAATMAKTLRGARARASGAASWAATFSSLGAAPALALGADDPRTWHVARALPGGGLLALFANLEGDTRAVTVSPRDGCADARWYDPWRNALSPAPSTSGGLALELPPYGSAVLLCGVTVDPALATGAPHPSEPAAARRTPLADWTLDVEGDDVVGGAFELHLSALVDWSEIDALRYSSSVGTYRTTIELANPSDAAACPVLDLGWLHGAATVRIDGADVARLLAPPFTVDLAGRLGGGAHTLEVVITSAPRNRYLGKALSGDPQYAQFRGRGAARLPAGLTGPTELVLGCASAG